MDKCLRALKQAVISTTAEPYLLSILQHLICIRSDKSVKTAYYQLIEECVSQIVLHKDGCDPDFRPNQKFHLNVEPLLEQMISVQGNVSDPDLI